MERLKVWETLPTYESWMEEAKGCCQNRGCFSAALCLLLPAGRLRVGKWPVGEKKRSMDKKGAEEEKVCGA